MSLFLHGTVFFGFIFIVFKGATKSNTVSSLWLKLVTSFSQDDGDMVLLKTAISDVRAVDTSGVTVFELYGLWLWGEGNLDC